ncbi:hypothetical protein [Glycomyces lechevalierae]|uniref:C2H2-type domain-containing protein n=1 Tax=Glycomyces lechevalierae TaxID=256034 RepID=A0ABU2AHY0_9ACTN|nr:hypothetical protein [Glycomyces lechevalierae]MDR7336806.1 hypothetical protein [Glycomyces lechevalierae]
MPAQDPRSGPETAGTVEDHCVACGSSLTISCDEAHQQHDTYHPDGHERPQPRFRDVMAAAHRAGLHFNRVSDEYRHDSDDEVWRHRTYTIACIGRESGAGTLVLDVGDCWTAVEISGRCGSVDMIDPTPAQVLAAARLVGLGGTT